MKSFDILRMYFLKPHYIKQNTKFSKLFLDNEQIINSKELYKKIYTEMEQQIKHPQVIELSSNNSEIINIKQRGITSSVDPKRALMSISEYGKTQNNEKSEYIQNVIFSQTIAITEKEKADQLFYILKENDEFSKNILKNKPTTLPPGHEIDINFLNKNNLLLEMLYISKNQIPISNLIAKQVHELREDYNLIIFNQKLSLVERSEIYNQFNNKLNAVINTINQNKTINKEINKQKFNEYKSLENWYINLQKKTQKTFENVYLSKNQSTSNIKNVEQNLTENYKEVNNLKKNPRRENSSMTDQD